MASPAERLMEEHVLVRCSLDVLTHLADHVGAGQMFPSDDVGALLRFFNSFVEAVHLAKEVEFLLPRLAAHAGEEEAELAGRLIGEHDETRALLHCLMMFWEPLDDILDEERQGFRELARAYADRMRRHMLEEERILFPLVRRCIPPDDVLAILAGFDAIDRQRQSSRDWQTELSPLVARWSA